MGAGHGKYGHLTANQIGDQRREPIESTLRRAIFDRCVLAFYKARFLQALVERSNLLTQ